MLCRAYVPDTLNGAYTLSFNTVPGSFSTGNAKDYT